MSSIEKLLIRGIRSFSPDSQNVIEFYNPVTIIVGHNGAGKTTIIECLKYATTGDLPPNAKGGAFVHDPKLAADSEVKAQIRLKFRNVRGQSMVVTRSMQSTLKKNGKLEQKSLEGLLVTTDPNTGEQVSISTRCAELDGEIPLHLGVSRAVLENVIFCHQEESFWPLSEPSVLKKKFDDIFAATKYTKALDALKGLRKDMSSDLKLESQNLEFLRHEQEKARRLEGDLANCEQRIADTTARISSLDSQIEATSAGIEKSEAELQVLNSLIAEIERLEHDLTNTLQAKADLEASLQKVLTGSQEELQSQLDELMDAIRGAAQSVAEFESQKASLLSAIEAHTREFSQLCTERGSLQAQNEALSSRREDRLRLLKELAQMFELPIDSVETTQLMISVAERFQSQRDRIAALKAEIASQDASRQSQIQSSLSKHAALEESRRSRMKSIDECQESLLKLEEQLADISNASDDVMAAEEQAIKNEESTLNGLKAQQSARQLEEALKQKQRQHSEAEAQQDRIQQALASASQTAHLRAQLSMKEGECAKKTELINRLFEEYCNASEGSVLVSNWLEAERDFDAKARERASQLKAAQERFDEANQHAAMTSSNLAHVLSQLQSQEQSLQSLQNRLASLPNSSNLAYDSIDSQIRRLEAEITAIRDQEALIQGIASVYQTFSEKIKKSPDQCPLCESHLSAKEALAEHIHSQADASTNRERLQQDRQSKQSKLQSVLEVKPLWQEIEQIRSESLPTLRSAHARAEEADRLARQAVEEARVQLNALGVEERRAGLLRRRLDEGLRQTRELPALQDELSLLRAQLPQLGPTDDPETLQAHSLELRNEAKAALAEVERLAEEIRNRDAQIARFESALRDRREALMKRQLQRSLLHRLQSDKRDAAEQLTRLRSELAKINTELEASSATLATLRANRDSWFASEQSRLEAAQSALDSAQVAFTQLDSLQAEIERLEGALPPELLARLNDRIRACEADIAAKQAALEALQASASLKSKQAAQVQLEERCLRDNLRVRELTSRITNLQEQLHLRNAKLSGIDRGSLGMTHQRAQMRRSDLMGERAGLIGELRQMEESASRMRGELSGEYAHVAAKLQNQLVRVKALQLGADDLEKYARALDSAIMKYHSVKMDEINAIIRELWTSTYQGTDIDTIEIRADHETTTVAAANGRSYNYRVVMCKGGVELDMRGRSSAGQRVLACLIIRLALAEVFGLHCGILALDEPTTNLDRDNIGALAAALASIIRTRRTQSNFQLILITHDEEFVQILGRYECAEYYWRVFKDESQHSCIERQSIAGVMG